MGQACGAGKPVFAIAPYEPDETGVLRVVLPQRCVFAARAERCGLFVDHYRDRKTGPCFALAVVGCGHHPLGRYTLYPPGHTPYGRQALVPCSPSGPLLCDASTGQPVWQATLLVAATDAAAGQRWPAHSPAHDARRRRTQGRWLERAGTLLGVHPKLDARHRERLATRLRVPTLTLRTAAGGWATSWKARGGAIGSVLQALAVDESLLDRLLAAGAVTGLWPPPQRWDRRRKTWCGRSQRKERPGTGTPSSRGPPPTNSPAARRRPAD